MANEMARRLRREMTIDETKLWSELRDLRRVGFHFRRQAPIDDYIVDFLCNRALLVIEVDGVQHHTNEGRKKDVARDAHLAWRGYKVLRFTNGEVTHTLDGVMLEILAELGLAERPPESYRGWFSSSEPGGTSRRIDSWIGSTWSTRSFVTTKSTSSR